nr:RecName: Full=Pardaxin-1; AltName: Full=Pardaxin I; Short=PXI [Pardachirus marmoratus]
GFFALIPGIE